MTIFADKIFDQDAWQQRGGTPHYEGWADIFSNYIANNINTQDEVGLQIMEFAEKMETYIKEGGQ